MAESKVSKMIQRLIRRAIRVEPAPPPKVEPARCPNGKLLTEEMDDVTLQLESLVPGMEPEPEPSNNHG